MSTSKLGGPVLEPTDMQAALGAGAVAVTFGGILASMALAPWFTLTGNALSDLGAVGRTTAPVFNGALLLGGVLGCGFVAATWTETDSPARAGALVVLFLALVFMGLVGAFPLPTAPHGVVAVLFFLLMTVGIAVWGGADLAGDRPARGGALLTGSLLHVAGWLWWGLLGWPGEGIAVPELLGAATLGVWALWVAVDAVRPPGRSESTEAL